MSAGAVARSFQMMDKPFWSAAHICECYTSKIFWHPIVQYQVTTKPVRTTRNERHNAMRARTRAGIGVKFRKSCSFLPYE